MTFQDTPSGVGRVLQDGLIFAFIRYCIYRGAYIGAYIGGRPDSKSYTRLNTSSTYTSA